jgi:hypothetical protein
VCVWGGGVRGRNDTAVYLGATTHAHSKSLLCSHPCMVTPTITPFRTLSPSTITTINTTTNAGAFCSKACGLESDPDALRCSVCFAVFTGGEHAVAPDGSRRHMLCAVPCDACGTRTTRPLYFKTFAVSDLYVWEGWYSPARRLCAVLMPTLFSVAHRQQCRCMHISGAFCLQGAYCSNACGKRSDPASVPCCVCGKILTDKYVVESSGPLAGSRRHPQCFPAQRQVTAAGRR